MIQYTRVMIDNEEFTELKEIVSICVDEIIKLKEENGTLKNDIKDLITILNSLVEGDKKLNLNMNRVKEEVYLNTQILNRSIDNMKYEWNDDRLRKETFWYPSFYAIEDTIEKLINGKKSMVRFGDGEFSIMSNKERQKFQKLDDKLAVRLKEVINTDKEEVLVAIADNYGSLEQYNETAKREIRYYMTDNVREEHKKYLHSGRKYHNAYITRPYAIFADNGTDAPQKRFKNLKRIWEKRRVIFVEGALTRLGVGNDLFDNVEEIRRIEAPAVNSFDKYDEILEKALQFAEPECLFLIALGPTAGVLAYDLCCAGYQAIDIGHVDLEYEWFLRGTGGRCEVKNKYNNEFAQGDMVEEIFDEDYMRQIVCVIESAE